MPGTARGSGGRDRHGGDGSPARARRRTSAPEDAGNPASGSTGRGETGSSGAGAPGRGEPGDGGTGRRGRGRSGGGTSWSRARSNGTTRRAGTGEGASRGGTDAGDTARRRRGAPDATTSRTGGGRTGGTDATASRTGGWRGGAAGASSHKGEGRAGGAASRSGGGRTGGAGRTGAGRRADGRERVRGRAEAARPDPSGRATRSRSGRGDRDSGRPSTRRPRSDAVRARRTAPGARRPPTRGRYLARRWVAVLAVLTVVAAAYLVMYTSLLGVRSVEVIGTREIPRNAVLAAAAIEHGTPMVRLDADEAAARVAALPRVFEVVVERSWPSTVEIIVTERAPVAVLRVGRELHLVDGTGLDYAVVRTPPSGLPTLAMSDVRPGNPATKAAVTVLGDIPEQLKTRVTTVTAATPGDVRLTLADGRVVKWGNARDNARKAAVLAPLLTRPGRTYDVATPDFPTVSG